MNDLSPPFRLFSIQVIPAFLTSLLFSFSVIFAARSASVLGAQAANLARITLACVFLAIWSHIWGSGLGGPSLSWFFLSGIIGFGIGDVALFGALPRIGPRLAILLTQCLAAPIGALAEWLWMGTVPTGAQMGSAAIILVGVALALAPERGFTGTRGVFLAGVAFGVVSAMGQAMGAVVSRRAIAVANDAALPVDGGTAAYQRILGGVLVTVIVFLFLHFREKARRTSEEKPPIRLLMKKAWPLVLGNALSGPCLGVGCYQWALSKMPTGIVLALVSTSPLVTMLLHWKLDGQKPTRRSAIGGVLAVVGVAGLVLAR